MTIFQGSREPTAIVAKWWELYESYYEIIGFTGIDKGNDEATSVLTERVSQILRTAVDVGTKFDKLKIPEIYAWVSDCHNGWFPMMYDRCAFGSSWIWYDNWLTF